MYPAPRPSLKEHAPKITTLKINPDKIKDVIGPGGKVIKKITEESGAKIDIEEDGTVYVAAADQPLPTKLLKPSMPLRLNRKLERFIQVKSHA